MKRKSIKRIKSCIQIFVSFCILFSNFVYAMPSMPKQHQRVTPVHTNNSLNNKYSSEGNGINSLSSSDFGVAGPLSFRYSHEDWFGDSWGIKYTQRFGDVFAGSALVESGPDTSRLGATIGFRLFENGFAKASAEKLSQELPFHFSTGDINQKMHQNAYGARYQHIFDNEFLRGIDFGGYYANTPNKWLDPIIFKKQLGEKWIHERHIAGATSKGLDAGVDLAVTGTTGLTGHVYHDVVKYNTRLDKCYGKCKARKNYDGNGIGVSLGVTQIVTDKVKFVVEGEKRKLYDTYQATVSWVPPVLSTLGLELSLIGKHVRGYNQTPNTDEVLFDIGFHFDKIGSYKLPSLMASKDLNAWTSEPAVYMQRVLAVSEECVKHEKPIPPKIK